jgi:hypothetical protein
MAVNREVYSLKNTLMPSNSGALQELKTRIKDYDSACLPDQHRGPFHEKIFACIMMCETKKPHIHAGRLCDSFYTSVPFF